jgi:hypothetical protein
MAHGSRNATCGHHRCIESVADALSNRVEHRLAILSISHSSTAKTPISSINPPCTGLTLSIWAPAARPPVITWRLRGCGRSQRPPASMKNHVIRLWRGEVGLARVFWDYAIIYGSLANLITTGGAFAALTADLPAWLAVAIFFLPLPYNVLIVVAVWRSAGRYAGPPMWARLARIAVIVWAAIATLA